MPEPQIISPSEVLAAAGADKPVTQGTFLQRTGLLLASGVGAVIALVILTVVAKVVWGGPPAPTIPAGTDAVTVKAMIENYKTLQQVTLEPYTTLLDNVVVKVLLPVFTSILGYIFGSRNSKE